MLRKSLLALTFALTLVLPCPVFAEPPEIVIPSEFGAVESRESSTTRPTPIVVLIQDAHAYYEAQKNLSEILKFLIQTYGLERVFVEGGVGNVDLSEFIQGIPPERVTEVAEEYLKAGKLHGEEFLDLTFKEGRIELWGIEDPVLYEENVKAFLNFQAQQAGALAEVQKAQEKAQALKSQLYPKDFLKLDSLRERARSEKASPLLYFGLLEKEALASHIALEAFPTFKQWLDLRNEEKALDFSQLTLEKNELTGALSRGITKEEFYPVRQALEAEQRGNKTPLLKTLLELQKKYSPKFDSFSVSNVDLALRASEASSALDATLLFEQADSLYLEIRRVALPEGKASDVVYLSDYLELAAKLFRFEWTPKDNQRYENLIKEWKPNQEETLTEIEKFAHEALQFYEIAKRREKFIFENAVKKMAQEQKAIYAVVVGGFHAEALSQMFREANFSLLSVRPNFQLSSEPQNYAKLFSEMWGRGQAWHRSVSKAPRS